MKAFFSVCHGLCLTNIRKCSSAPKFSFDPNLVDQFLHDFCKRALLVAPKRRVHAALDEADNRFLECARSAGKVSGDGQSALVAMSDTHTKLSPNLAERDIHVSVKVAPGSLVVREQITDQGTESQDERLQGRRTH
jgi:hypothetical protein